MASEVVAKACRRRRRPAAAVDLEAVAVYLEAVAVDLEEPPLAEVALVPVASATAAAAEISATVPAEVSAEVADPAAVV